MNKTEITHDPDRRRYSLMADWVEAYLTYERPSPGVRRITHTIVPDQIGGRGHGQRLVARIMEDIIAEDERVSASCWFAKALIEKRAEWAARAA